MITADKQTADKQKGTDRMAKKSGTGTATATKSSSKADAKGAATKGADATSAKAETSNLDKPTNRLTDTKSVENKAGNGKTAMTSTSSSAKVTGPAAEATEAKAPEAKAPEAKAPEAKPAKAASKTGGRSKSKAKSTPGSSSGQSVPLKTTLQQIEKQFGEGGNHASWQRQAGQDQRHSDGQPFAGPSFGAAKASHVDESLKSSDRNRAARPRLRLHVVAEAQQAGGIAAFIDAEHALDPTWAKKLGVELETLLVSQPTCGEEAMHITEMLIKSNAVDVIVIDSVAALIPRQELEGDIGDTHVGLQARLMSQSMRKLTGAIAKSKTSVIFINQIREKIGVMFGSPETTPGGRALKFYCSCRIDVRRIGALKDGEEVVGQRVRAKVVKNKVAPPFRIAEFDMMHNNGISYEGDVLDLAVEDKIVVRAGAWFRYGDVQLGQGKEKARAFLSENPEMTEEIKQKVFAAKGLISPEAQAEAEASGENN